MVKPCVLCFVRYDFICPLVACFGVLSINTIPDGQIAMVDLYIRINPFQTEN